MSCRGWTLKRVILWLLWRISGMDYDGCNRRDVNGKANAGLTLGIIGTALGG